MVVVVVLVLLVGSLGKYVYMVKVSPVEDVNPSVSRGDHVLVVYNTCYTDTQQVMRVENRLRSVGLYLPLNYKPDVFSALGIYRNNKWGFRTTIYSSKAMVMEGRSRVETVGTGKWYYNSSKGLLYPSSSNLKESKTGNAEAMMTEVRDGERKEDSGIAAKEIIDDKKLATSPVGIPGFRLESMDKMKNMQESPTNTGLKMFPMESLDKMIKDNAGGGDHGNKEKSAKKSSWSHRLTAKISDLGNESKKAVEVKEAKHETS